MAQLIFYCYYLLAAVVVLQSICGILSERIIKYWYVGLSAPLVLFASFRPIGMMRDDIFYANIPNWRDEDYFSKISSLRDPLFYAFAWLLGLVSKDPELILYFSGVVLFLKLVILYELSGRWRLVLLFMYMSIYWQLHDLTQLRVSLSALFFLAYFLFIKKNDIFLQRFSVFSSILSHAQGVLNVLFLFKPPKFSNYFLVAITMLFVGLMVCRVQVPFSDLYVLLDWLLGRPMEGDFNYQFREAVRSYYLISLNSIEKGYPLFGVTPPIIFSVSIVVYLLLIFSLEPDVCQRPAARMAITSIVLAVFLSWLFSSVSDVQVRFYEYYFIAGLVLASEATSGRVLVGVYLLSLAYFVKFNIRWEIWDMGYINTMLSGVVSRTNL